MGYGHTRYVIETLALFLGAWALSLPLRTKLPFLPSSHQTFK